MHAMVFSYGMQMFVAFNGGEIKCDVEKAFYDFGMWSKRGFSITRAVLWEVRVPPVITLVLMSPCAPDSKTPSWTPNTAGTRRQCVGCSDSCLSAPSRTAAVPTSTSPSSVMMTSGCRWWRDQRRAETTQSGESPVRSNMHHLSWWSRIYTTDKLQQPLWFKLRLQ